MQCAIPISIDPLPHNSTGVSSPIKIEGIVHGSKDASSSLDEAMWCKAPKSRTQVDGEEATTTRALPFPFPLLFSFALLDPSLEICLIDLGTLILFFSRMHVKYPFISLEIYVHHD